MIPDDFTRRLRVCRWGALLALLTILFGFGFGGAFGAFEESMKQGLADRAAAVLDTVYEGNAAKAKSVVDKSWVYYKRAHLHGGAIGAVALGSILLLAALRSPPDPVRRGVSLGLGAGGLGYSVFWMLAARAAPGLGGTGPAKESLSWLAVPSAGLLLLGLVAVIGLTAIELFRPASTPLEPSARDRPVSRSVQDADDVKTLWSPQRGPSVQRARGARRRRERSS